MIRAIRYERDAKDAWNSFLVKSKNGLFLFDRDYMEYHADRFIDCSLLFLTEQDHLVGIFPASRHDSTVTSHGGLTFGGIMVNPEMKAATMLSLFDALRQHLAESGATKLIYKPVPHIFHRMPAEEELYALFINQARLFRRDASSAIYLPDRMKFAKGKREGIRKAQRKQLQVRESRDFETFFSMGQHVLQSRHHVTPVHTGDEMSRLADRFPQAIRLHASFDGERMLAGAITYVYTPSVHVQYMYNSDEGLEYGALDIVLDHLINDAYAGCRYFSLGTSTEEGGRYLNQGLMHQKEMLGARTIVHDFYEMDLVT